MLLLPGPMKNDGPGLELVELLLELLLELLQELVLVLLLLLLHVFIT